MLIRFVVRFRWNGWNLDHATRHGVSPTEAEHVVANARPPYPQYRGDGKWLVIGRGFAGAPVQVVYVVDADGTIYVIHARPLTDTERRRHRRRRR
jgi:uncharacterized DUF497 family protein